MTLYFFFLFVFPFVVWWSSCIVLFWESIMLESSSFLVFVYLSCFWFVVVQSLSCVWLFVTPWTPGFPVLHHLLQLAQTFCPSSRWCHPTISSSVIPFSSCLQFFPASGSFVMSRLFISGGQGVRALPSVLPMNIQNRFHLGLTGLISLQSKRLSRVFSNTTLQNHQFFSTQPSLWSNSHIHTWLLEKPFSSVQFSHSVVSDSLRPHESQHTRPPCPSPTPRVHSDSRPSSQWCHPAISSSVIPFSPAPNPSQHQSLFQWVNSWHEVAKVLEFQL